MIKRVDVIVAVHSMRRPVGRAVRSVVEGNPEARVVVLCHNVSPEDIVREHPGLTHPAVEVLQLDDGIPSPSGPFNHGIQRSVAEFVSIMGSDDMLDPGAVANWLRAADRHAADAVITRLVRGESRELVRSPVVRFWRRGALDIVKDRLPYRSAPLGLVRRDTVDRLGLVLTPGARNGGDLEFVSRLWTGGRVVYATGPGYVEMADAQDRVTHVMKSVGEELLPARELLGSEWFRAQPNRVRRAIAVKLIRRNLVDSILKRRNLEWHRKDIETLWEAAGRMVHSASGVWELLSLHEVRLLRAVHEYRFEDLADLASETKAYRNPATLLGPDLRSWFHPAGAARYAVAAALLR